MFPGSLENDLPQLGSTEVVRTQGHTCHREEKLRQSQSLAMSLSHLQHPHLLPTNPA